jgi:hypothetical protein
MRSASTIVELVHALLMVAWIVGLPLLFWHRFPRLTRWYGYYAIGFVLLSQASHYLLGECFVTTIARYLWEHGAPTPSHQMDEWFTVRLAQRVFGLTPSRREIVWASQIGVVVTAAGVLIASRAARRRNAAGSYRTRSGGAEASIAHARRSCAGHA